MKHKKIKQDKNKKLDKRITIISIIVIVAVLIIIVFGLQLKFNNIHKNTYEVNDENDDGRTFTVQISEGYGNEYEAGALLQLAPSYSFGVKFDNISIPQGAKIVDAYVGLYSIGTPGHDRPNCRIYCDNTDNAANFSTVGVLDICGRKYTKSFVSWNTTAPYDKWVKTPSIVGSIQEVINRKNWASGNSVAVLFVSKGFTAYSAAFRNYNTGYPAKLYIEWRETS